MQSIKTRPGVDCGLDHELIIAKFRLKLKKVGKTTTPFRYAAAAAAAKSLQSCPTLCVPIEGSSPGSPVPGILQARPLFTIAKTQKQPKCPLTCECLRYTHTGWSITLP